MKSLMRFEHMNATTIDDAVSALHQRGDKAWVVAGGTDIIGMMRFEILPEYPEVLINLKTIPGLDYIKEEDGILKIGTLTRLEDIAQNFIAKNSYIALSEAANRTASPHVRAMGTIGGNLCQLNRCWYFRKEDNRFDCTRKGGRMCHATFGENRYHSIFGAVKVANTNCSSSCPAGVDIPSYLSKIRKGRYSEAAKTLIDSNPMPAITGRVCPHYCEQNCNRGQFDEAVSIRSIERYIGDFILDHVDTLFKPPQGENSKRIAIIGSGPAGLSASFYLRRLGYRVMIYEAMAEPGGILTYGIPPFRLPKDVVRRQIKAFESTGIQIRLNVTIGKDITLEDLQRDYDAIFCATGAWEQPSLEIEDAALLTPGLQFLSQVNQGLREISSKKVLVIGGGSVAIDVALSARRLGVEQVTIACLESKDEMPALSEEVDQAIKEGINLLPSWGPSKILKENNQIHGMELVKCTSVYDSAGGFAPTYDKTVKKSIEADQIILAIGQRPNLSHAELFLEIQRGLLAVNPDTQATNIPNVFAGGDATISGPLSVVAAIATGRKAAESINRYLGGKDAPIGIEGIKPLERYSGEDFAKLKRVQTPKLPTSQLGLDFEDTLGLDSNTVEMEAKRCINCGCDAVNPSDMAPALVALNAKIVTSKRTIPADDFWAVGEGLKSTILENDEIMTEVHVPKPKDGVKSAFIKFALRKSIDFPIVNCAAAIESKDGIVKSARICLNAVYNSPYRATKAEDFMLGKPIDETNAEAAGVATVSDAIALPYNKFKIQIAKTLVKRAILACK